MVATSKATPTSTATTAMVVGSTGHIGFNTIRALSTKGIPILAGVRNTASAKALELANLEGVDVVQADLGDPATLLSAMNNISTVFIVTPGAEDRAELVAAGVDAAKAAGVAHIVVVSVPAVVAEGDLVFKKQFSIIEDKVTKSGLKHTILRLPMFIENQWANQGSITSEGKIYGPSDSLMSVSLVSVADAAEAAAVVLANPENHQFKTYTLVSDTVTFDKIATSFADAVDKSVTYVRVPYEAAVQAMVGLGFPEWQAKGVAQLLQLVDDSSSAAVLPTRDLVTLLGREPTSFNTWLRGVADAFKA